jgi:hypothetical protein
MIKLVALLKRKPGMRFDDFIRAYEHGHAIFAAPYLKSAERYERRFVLPYGNLVDGRVHESDFDVITEVWFSDRESFDAAMSQIGRPEIALAFAQDEANLFDRDKTRLFTVELESQTILAEVNARRDLRAPVLVANAAKRADDRQSDLEIAAIDDCPDRPSPG